MPPASIGRLTCLVFGTLALLVLGPACGSRRIPGAPDVGAQSDGIAVDQRPPLPDQGLTPCPESCPAPAGNTICLAGRVSQLPGLAARWSGLITSPTPLNDANGAAFTIHDPIAFVTNPTGAPPLASATVDASGCFVAKQVTIPFSGFFAIGVDDLPASSPDRWVLTVNGVTPGMGQNLKGLEIGAVAISEAKAWSGELGADVVQQGAMIMVFLDDQGAAVKGVTPVLAGQPPPWTGSGVYFFADDIRTPPYFDKGASATSSSGMVLVTKAAVKSYWGTHTSCKFKTEVGLSAPGTLALRLFRASGC